MVVIPFRLLAISIFILLTGYDFLLSLSYRLPVQYISFPAIGNEALNDFRDEDLVLDVEGLNVDDGCYTWYMSVKDKVADWYNMEIGEALCCYKVTRKDELLQDVYLEEEEKSPPEQLNIGF